LDWDEIWQECSSSKICVDLMSHFQDGGHGVISRNKVLPPASACAEASISSFVYLFFN